jgi:hypothetical protein
MAAFFFPVSRFTSYILLSPSSRLQTISELRILFKDMSRIIQNIMISGLLLIFMGSYLEIPLLISTLSPGGQACCSGSGKCCCNPNETAETSRDGSCSVACAGCCHHTSVSLPQLTREFYPKAIFNSEHFSYTNFFLPFSQSSYTLLLTRDIFRPPTA